MSNEISVVYEQNVLGKQFQIYGSREEPLFLARDVAEWIEHSDTSTMMRSVDDNEKLIQTILVSGQNREAWFLTEDGLYEVLMQSRKPIAKQFKREVKEILKSIRKDKQYITEQSPIVQYVNNALSQFGESYQQGLQTQTDMYNEILEIKNIIKNMAERFSNSDNPLSLNTSFSPSPKYIATIIPEQQIKSLVDEIGKIVKDQTVGYNRVYRRIYREMELQGVSWKHRLSRYKNSHSLKNTPKKITVILRTPKLYNMFIEIANNMLIQLQEERGAYSA